MDKRQVLQNITFGERIAEDEVDELSSYFVETNQWQSIFAGDVDVVYGAKGSGLRSLMGRRLSRRRKRLQYFGKLIGKRLLSMQGNLPKLVSLRKGDLRRGNQPFGYLSCIVMH